VKKVLVIGSNSFVGKALKRRLLSNDYTLFEMNSDSDITEPENFFKFKNEPLDYVFHLAAKTFVPDSWVTPTDFYHTNVLGTGNVLDFCRQESISLTYVSAYLYGQPEKLPISEDDNIQPNNPYAHSKYLAEQICEFYAKEFGLSVIVLRPFNAYGIGQSDKFLVPHVIKQALNNNEIKVKDLNPKRDYIYIDDLIDALIMSVAFQEHFGVFNIGSGSSVSVKELIDVVQGILGTNKEVLSENNIRKNEMDNVVADISKAKRELGWSPLYSFNQGIEKIIEYEKRNIC
jgi:nucleoside-diphosphate-sugar epimerase